MRWCGSCFGMPQLLKCKITEILHWFKEKILPVRYNKKGSRPKRVGFLYSIW